MIRGIVAKRHLEGIERQSVATMIVDGLECRKRKQEDALSDAHARDVVGDGGAEGVEQETFEPVVIERAIGVGDV